MDERRQLITFLNESEKLKSTLRHNWMTSGRQEDSSQHSWRAALFFILTQELWQLGVDPYKTLVMLIMHDLPETKYGDIAGFMKETNLDEHTKHKLREQEAAKQLYNLLPDRLSERFIALQEEFEKGESREAKIAQALEKIETQLQHLESGPAYWSEEERGDHMLHYPDKAVDKLGDDNISGIWEIIQREIHKLTYPEQNV